MSGHSKLEEISEVIFQARLTVAMLEMPVVAKDPEAVAKGLREALAAYDGADSKGASNEVSS